MRTTSRLSAVLMLCLFVALTACGENGNEAIEINANNGDHENNETDECTPQETTPCTCDGGVEGVEICDQSNTYGECICPGEDDPVFSATPEVLHFSDVGLGGSEQRSVSIQNIGPSELVLSNIRIDVEDEASHQPFVEGPNWPDSEITLQSTETIELTVIYEPQVLENIEAVVAIDTNIGVLPTAVIPLLTMSLAPEIFAQSHVDFPTVAPGSSDWQLVDVTNIGAGPLHISDIFVTPDNGFEISFPGELLPDGQIPPVEDDSDSFPDKLDADESLMIRVSFHPENDSPATAELILLTNDPMSPEYPISLHANTY